MPATFRFHRLTASKLRHRAFAALRREVVMRFMMVVVVTGLVGCQTQATSGMTLRTTKYTLEQTEKLKFLDASVQANVSSTGIQHSILADGRLQVVVNMRNRINRPVPIQLSAVFKDMQGFPTGEETEWLSIALSQNSTEAVRFVSTQSSARNFTIRVRGGHATGP